MNAPHLCLLTKDVHANKLQKLSLENRNRERKCNTIAD
jgi:hypothetical protein